MTGHACRTPGVRLRAASASALALAVLAGAGGCTSSGSQSSASLKHVDAPAATVAPAAAVISAAGAATSAAAAGPAAAAATSAAAAASAGAAAGAPVSAAASAGPAAAAGTADRTPSGTGNSGKLLEGRPGFQADPTAGRSVIYTAHMTVQVDTPADVATQADQAAADAQAANGYVFSRSGQAAVTDPASVPAGSTPAPTGVAQADLTFKVPPGSAYNQLLDDLGNLGDELSVQENSQDVTNQVVDTTARLATMKASVARIRTLLTKATTIGQIVNVEGELTRREADLESLEGTLTVLKAQTSLATISLHLQSKPLTPKTVLPPKPKRPIHGFLGGLKAGGRGFASAAVGFATVLGALLPFLGLLLVVALIAWWGRRSWH